MIDDTQVGMAEERLRAEVAAAARGQAEGAAALVALVRFHAGATGDTAFSTVANWLEMVTGEKAVPYPVSGLTKLTVNLSPAAVEALDDASTRTGHSRTDTLSRAVQIYAETTRALEAGGATLAVDDQFELAVRPR